MEPEPVGKSEVSRPLETIAGEMLAAASKKGGWDIPGFLSGALELSQRELTNFQRGKLRGFGKEVPEFRKDLRAAVGERIDKSLQEQDKKKIVESLKLARILGIADPIDETDLEIEYSQKISNFLDQQETSLSVEEPVVPVPSVPAETPASTGPAATPVPVTEPAKEPQEEKKPVVLSPEMVQFVDRLAKALLKGEQTKIDELIAEIARSKDLGENGLDISQVLAISEAVANEITQKRTSSKSVFTASLPPEIQTQFQTWWEQYTKAVVDRDYESVGRLEHEVIPILNTTLPESAKILTIADYDKYQVPTFHLFDFLPEIVPPGGR